MKKRIYILILAVWGISFTSCDSFLDINPESEVVNDDMFSTKRGVEDAVWGFYGKLKQENLYGESLSWAYTEVLAQNFSGPNRDLYTNMETYNYENILPNIDVIWTNMYEIIGHTNNFITNLEAKESNSLDLYNLYLGEAYGLRAFLHFELLRLFAPHVENKPNAAGIPYVTEYSFEHTPFSSVSEVYGKIIADLKKAQELLQADADNLVYPRVDATELEEDFLKGREIHFNLYAATATLARVYWMKGELDNAKEEALKVINSNKFPLAEKDEIINLIAGTLSPKESIWGLYSTNYFEITKKKLYTSNSWDSFGPYEIGSGGQYLLPYDQVYSQYLGENSGSDARLNWFRPAIEGMTTINILKVVDAIRVGSDQAPAGRGLIEGISMLRIPEMYYIVAEAELEKGNIDVATTYVNKVLTSRGLTKLEDRSPALSLDMDLLYNERHKEMFGEGQRWFDMKKRNMDIISNADGVVLPASDKIYVLPIPVTEYDYRNE